MSEDQLQNGIAELRSKAAAVRDAIVVLEAGFTPPAVRRRRRRKGEPSAPIG